MKYRQCTNLILAFEKFERLGFNLCRNNLTYGRVNKWKKLWKTI